MNILYVAADVMNICDFVWAYMEMGHQVQTLDVRTISTTEKINLLERTLQEQSFDFVLTNDFFIYISDVCQKMHIPYVSWNFDAPYYDHYSPSARNDYNYIFTFDKNEYQALKELQLPHVYYQPLCINPSRVGALEITPEDEQQFSCDISFVGGLYENNMYNKYKHLIPHPYVSTLENILNRYQDDYRSHLIEESITEEELSLLDSLFSLPKGANDYYSMSKQKALYNIMISPKMTEMDRIRILNHLAKTYRVSLFTNSCCDTLKNVDIHGSVNYDTDMNKIFYLSKINLNISFRQITSGIPQRVFDIMACGGFVVTNRQTEISDFFEKGKDIEVFESMKELDEIVEYYLHHERERIRIAMNGYQKVISHHTYRQRADFILNTLPLNNQDI